MNRKFDQTTDLPPGASIERRTPVGLRQAFLLPAIVLGAGAVALVGSFFIVAGLEIGLPWGAVLIAAGAVALLGLVYLVGGRAARDMLSQALWITETLTGRDVNHDGQVGRPSFEIVERTPGPYGDNLRMFDLPGEPEHFAQVCYKSLTGTALTQSNFSGKGKAYSRGTWSDLCDEMVRRKWWDWVNEKHHPAGIVILPEGRRKMAQWLEQYGRANTRTHAQGHVLEHIEDE